MADFVASFAKIPAGHDARRVAEQPRGGRAPGQRAVPEGMRPVPRDRGLHRGRHARRPELFAWGSPRWITRMIRKPGAPDLYGYLEAKDRMPAVRPEQLTDNDVDMVIRFLRNDYPMPTGRRDLGRVARPRACRWRAAWPVAASAVAVASGVLRRRGSGRDRRTSRPRRSSTSLLATDSALATPRHSPLRRRRPRCSPGSQKRGQCMCSPRESWPW